MTAKDDLRQALVNGFIGQGVYHMTPAVLTAAEMLDAYRAEVLREAAEAWREAHPEPIQAPGDYMDPRSFALWLERRAGTEEE